AEFAFVPCLAQLMTSADRSAPVTPESLPKALLVGVRLPGVSEQDFEASLDELERLVKTLGYRVVARITQTRSTLAQAAVLGEGKLAELAAITGGSGEAGVQVERVKDKARIRREAVEAGKTVSTEDDDEDDEAGPAIAGDLDDLALIAVDHEISPSQLRNLERASGITVLDRTGVIIEIFHRHAHSREARMQVEIARLRYESPRVRESPRGKERQAGRGSGEAGLELDRRKIRDRIAELKEQLEAVQKEYSVRRAKRQEARRVALVGYTNAGKSSLMRALTGSDVYVENKLFATLDTTVRALSPEVEPRVLVSDTVGFIKKLPHDLVASFKSTLDEASEASLLLHVVDASDPSWQAQLTVTREVLTEIGAHAVPSRLLMNKVDRLSPEALAELRLAQPEAWFLSAKSPSDVAALRLRIIEFFESSYVQAEVLVPFSEQRLLAEMHATMNVLGTRYEEAGVYVQVRSESALLDKLGARLPEGSVTPLQP
ncbi:MAG TPA: GTPase HflX, partial [Polyangiaceae bacterium]|nr:GTPase HflX [Polyangiaceae bacterium]